MLPQDPGDARLLTNLLTRMSAPVALNGRRGHAFVLDTGAGRTALSIELARDLGLAEGPPLLVHGITSAQMTPTVRVERLAFGGRRFRDLLCPVFPREALATEGLLGLDVLSGFRLTLQVRSRRVSLRASGSDVAPSGPAFTTATRMRPPRARLGPFGQLITTAVRADGAVGISAFVDTGAQYSIGNLALLGATGGRADGLPPVRVYGVTGQSRLAVAGRVGRLEMGGRDLGDTPLLFADLHAFDVLGLNRGPALLVGADLLQRFRTVVLDFGSGSLALRGILPPLE
ncbi:MAG: aspartyl protease family protein [Caulobacteraceae bacterium]|nr:aspartyl protease family protein [Caulobacteraceae bacterium]